MELPGAVKILEEDVSLVAKQRELAADMAKSPYFITPKYAVKDVERYSDRLQENGTHGQSLSTQLSPEMISYLPPELLNRTTSTAAVVGRTLSGMRSLPAFDAKSLTLLEAKERKNAETGADNNKDKDKDKDDAGIMSDIEGDMEEEEHDDDYAVDHYESAGDESMGDDEPAAVF